jgi:hypothetical protein
VTGYRVEGREGEGDDWRGVAVVTAPEFELEPGVGPAELRVRAVMDSGAEGWDWAGVHLP